MRKKSPGRPSLPADVRRTTRMGFRATEREVLVVRRLSAQLGEPDSEVLRCAVGALQREQRLVALLRAASPAAALRRVEELLGRRAA